jgi:predicted CopG family antitoxin
VIKAIRKRSLWPDTDPKIAFFGLNNRRFKSVYVYVLLHMSTKTVSLSEDAYKRLKSLKEDNESFSDVVRKVTKSSRISKFHGVLSEEKANEIEEKIHEHRERNREKHSDRVEEIADDLK